MENTNHILCVLKEGLLQFFLEFTEYVVNYFSIIS
jgi:hypothetical protein